jgi:hypothetical protein
MGTFYHTDESALQTVQDYKDVQGIDTLEEALEEMRCCYDDLDSEDRSAYDYVIKRSKEMRYDVHKET